MHFDPQTIRTHYASPLGSMILAATEQGLAGAWFTNQRHLPDWQSWQRSDQHPHLRQAQEQLAQYFSYPWRTGAAHAFDLPLDLRSGSPFQQQVWRALLGIPLGQTRSYGALAAQLGLAGGARAVGTAVGRNPISIIVPCHRVLGAGGALTGYAGGLERKIALLQLESTPP